jgi:DNA-binding beta-propeller fold protein YncE
MRFIPIIAVFFLSLSKVGYGFQYELNNEWTDRVNHDGNFGEVPGVSVDEKNRVWIFHRGTNDPLRLYDEQGNRIRVILPAKFKIPHQVRFLSGSLWTVDQDRHVVEKFSVGENLNIGVELRLILHIGIENVAKNDADHLDKPTDVAVAPNGDIYITDGYGNNNRVVRYTHSGKFIGQWGGTGIAAGEFQIPHSIVIDRAGLVYIADRSNQRMQVFESDGKFLSQWKKIVPWTMWISPNNDIWVCGSSIFDDTKLNFQERTVKALTGMIGIPPRDQVIMKINSGGKVLDTYTFPSLKLQWVHGISLDKDENLYLSEVKGQHRVIKLNKIP